MTTDKKGPAAADPVTTSTPETVIASKPLVKDPFADLSSLKLDQSFDINAEVDYTVIPVRRPSKQAWIRVSPEENHTLALAMIELERGVNGNADSQLYIVMPGVAEAVRTLPGFSTRVLRLCVQRPENSPFLWALRVPQQGRTDLWAKSGIEASKTAQSRWISVRPDSAAGCYTTVLSQATWPEPEWPDLPMNEILRRAFGEEKIITNLDHPVLQILRGEK